MKAALRQRKTRRPRWSVLVPAYNCAAFLPDSLGGVLRQDLGPHAMEIVVIDDHSDDECERTVRALGGDRVQYVRQVDRVGLVSNLNSCIQHARGELVHILHADDFVSDGFYEAMDAIFRADPAIGAAFCRVTYRDEKHGVDSPEPLLQETSGRIPDAVKRILLTGPQMSAGVVRREVYESVGGFNSRLTCSCEDWEMWVRIALRYPIGFEPTPLATYRYMRDGSLTSVHSETGRYAGDLVRAHRIVESYAPRRYRQLLRQARTSSADWMLANVALPFSLEGRTLPTVRNVWHALRCSPSPAHFRTGVRCLLNLVSATRTRRAL